jgi:hypothetical protein
MNEIIKLEGRLSIKKQEASKLKLRLKFGIKSIRDILDPFDAVDEIDFDMAAQEAVRLASDGITLKGVLDEIKALKKALNRS